MQKFEPKKWEIEDCCYIGQLSSYLDQELPEPEMKMVEAHLEDCDDCRFELMQLRQVDIVLRGEEPISPSPEFLINVRTLIKKRKRKPRKFWFNRFVNVTDYFLPSLIDLSLSYFSRNRKIIQLSIVSLILLMGIILHFQLPTFQIFSSEKQSKEIHTITEYVESTNLVLADSGDRQLQQLPHPMSSAFQWKYSSLTTTNQYSQP